MSLNKFSAVNKLMTPYLDFLENKKRFMKLKDSFGEEIFQELSDILDSIEFDHKSFIKTLRHTANTGTINTILSTDNTKNDSSTEESDIEDEEVKTKNNVNNVNNLTNQTKPKHNIYSKRLQFNKNKAKDKVEEKVEEKVVEVKKDNSEVVKKSKRIL